MTDIEAPTHEIRSAFLNVEGMMCGSCGAAVEAILQRQPGVTEASVNFAADVAHVEWQHDRTTLDEIQQSLVRSGYRPRETLHGTQTENRLDAFRRQLQIRLAVAIVFGMWSMLAAVLLYLEPFGVVEAVAKRPLAIASGFFALPVVTYSGFNFYVAGWRTLRSRVPGMDTLISLASLAAVFVSVWQLLVGRSTVYFDAAVMLITFQLVARVVDHGVRRNASAAIQSFLRAAPSTARRIKDGTAEQVSSAELSPGELVHVAANERVPVDGEIIEGRASLDASLLTGESSPRVVSSGDVIFAGCRSIDGDLLVRVTTPAGKRRIDALAQGIRGMLARKSALQKLTDRIARILIPVVMIAAIVAALLSLHSDGDIGNAMYRALAVLVVTCPCALSLAVPLVVLMATGSAVRKGMILRDPAALEAAADVKTVMFDKTGTLTGATPRVEDIDAKQGINDRELVETAAQATAGTFHPLAHSLSHYLGDTPVRGKRIVHPGCGVEWRTDTGTVLAGRADWLRMRGVAVPHQPEETTHVAVSRDGVYLGTIRFGESIRPEAALAIHQLRSMGCNVGLLSGDTAAACRHIGAQLGIAPESTHAARSPEDKRAILEELECRGPVLFAGDGLNDGPGLAAARFGVAVGAAESSASAAAAVSLPNGLRAIPALVQLSRSARRAMRQNLVWALVYNAIALPVAVAGFLHPAIAAIVMSLSTVAVLLNSLRLKWQLELDSLPGAFVTSTTVGQKSVRNEHRMEPAARA